MRTRRSKRGWLRNRAWIFAVIIDLLVFTPGAFLVLVEAPRQERDWRRIESSAELDLDLYAGLGADTFAVLTGHLDHNPVTTQYELVAYRIDEWRVTEDDDGDEEGNWHKMSQFVPPLAIAWAGGTVSTAEVDSVWMGGDLHEFLYASSSMDWATYRGKSVPDGSLRTQGFRNRDLVTVVGTKNPDGSLHPRRLFAGDRAGLVKDIQGDVLLLRILGGVFMGIGVLGFAIGAWVFIKWSKGYERKDDQSTDA